MAANTKSSVPKKILSRDLIFGPPPILEGEDAFAYDELFEKVSSGVNPTDFIEKIWIMDTVDLTWDIFRWRRLKARLLSDQIPDSLGTLLEEYIHGRTEEGYYSVGPSPAEKLAKKWAAGKPAAIERVKELMASRNVTMDSVTILAFMEKLDEIERIDHLIMMLEGRRNAALREIDRHRATLAQAMREKIREVEDAEFETIEQKKVIPRYRPKRMPHDERTQTQN